MINVNFAIAGPVVISVVGIIMKNYYLIVNIVNTDSRLE